MPGCVPDFTSTGSSPSTVGTRIVVPSAAWASPTDGLEDELRPLALQAGWGATWTATYSEPAGPPAARLALVGEPDLVALVDARRDRHLERPLPLDSALAPACLARRLDDRPSPLQRGQVGHVDHLAEHRLANAADLAPAVALGTRDRLRCPGFAPLPPQVSQRARTGNSISFCVPRIASSNEIRRS